jgi:hypothetical protein
VLCGGTVEHEYRTLYHARCLILSPSTFGVDGDAAQIYFPHEMGYWKARDGCRLSMRQPNFSRYDAQGELL